jgi:hypothetical protein
MAVLAQAKPPTFCLFVKMTNDKLTLYPEAVFLVAYDPSMNKL